MKPEPIRPADDTAASGILRCPNDAPAAYSEPLKPLPDEPASLAELAEAFRGLSDVMGLVISALVGRGVLDPGLLINGLARQAEIMRKPGREFRAGPAEFFVQEIPELLRTVDDMIARTAPAPNSKQ
jgi:hypothetical protein